MKFFYFALLVLFSLILISCSRYETIGSVDYIKIEKTKYDGVFHGVVKSNNSTILSFQSEGRIVYLPYTKGDFVKKGQTIAQLDNVLYEINRNEQKAKLQEYVVEQNKQKKYYDRLNILHKEGAISDNDWENAYFELKAIAAQIEVQKEKIKYIDKEISFSRIIAPFDGYISNKFIDNGSYAKVASPVVEFISSNGFQAEIMIGDGLINHLSIQDDVLIEIQNKIYNGKIAHIAKSSLNSGGYLIKISFDQIKDIKEGMSAQVKLNLKNNEMYLIPINSIVQENGQNYILKIVDVKGGLGSVQKTNVDIGMIFGDKVEVVNGVKTGDLILLNPYYSKKVARL